MKTLKQYIAENAVRGGKEYYGDAHVGKKSYRIATGLKSHEGATHLNVTHVMIKDKPHTVVEHEGEAYNSENMIYKGHHDPKTMAAHYRKIMDE